MIQNQPNKNSSYSHAYVSYSYNNKRNSFEGRKNQKKKKMLTSVAQLEYPLQINQVFIQTLVLIVQFMLNSRYDRTKYWTFFLLKMYNLLDLWRLVYMYIIGFVTLPYNTPSSSKVWKWFLLYSFIFFYSRNFYRELEIENKIYSNLTLKTEINIWIAFFVLSIKSLKTRSRFRGLLLDFDKNKAVF